MDSYSAIQKKEILSFGTTWMKLEGMMLCKISQTKTILYDLIYIWNLKNELIETEQIGC